MIPNTVPNNPTKGAVLPMVAKPLIPRFSSAFVMAVARSKARLEVFL